MNRIVCTSAMAEVEFPGTDLPSARLVHGSSVDTDASYRVTVGTVTVEAPAMSAIPSADRAKQLFEHAYYKEGVQVLGWADDIVLGSNSPVNFTVYPKPDGSHEDEVLIIALRVPHPDYMTLQEIVTDDVPISGF